RRPVRQRAYRADALLPAVPTRRDPGDPRCAATARAAPEGRPLPPHRAQLARVIRGPTPEPMPSRRDPGAGPNELDADLLTELGEPPGDGEPLHAPLTSELDLHAFLPRECADVVAEYVCAAQQAGMASVRIIHGKGTGTLRRIVHGVLDRHPAVRTYQL